MMRLWAEENNTHCYGCGSALEVNWQERGHDCVTATCPRCGRYGSWFQFFPDRNHDIPVDVEPPEDPWERDLVEDAIFLCEKACEAPRPARDTYWAGINQRWQKFRIATQAEEKELADLREKLGKLLKSNRQLLADCADIAGLLIK